MTAMASPESPTNAEELTEMANLLPLASAAQQPYVSELLSFTLDRLHKEPELLRVDAERIRRQMQEVAVGNYRAFIAAADALLEIRQEVSSIDKHLESLIGEIPKLTSGCTEFVESAEHILEKRKLNQTLLANQSTLLDLLEIPQLMDTFNGAPAEERLHWRYFLVKLGADNLKGVKNEDHLVARHKSYSIDALPRKSSRVCGVSPVILKSALDEKNMVLSLFRKGGEEWKGLGADQVILVRDDISKNEISGYVGNQALVLTIMECKGLEFELLSDENYDALKRPTKNMLEQLWIASKSKRSGVL